MAADLTVHNPYADVDWGTFEPYKFDLHTGHVEKLLDQDDSLEPADFVDMMVDAGLDICHPTYTANTEVIDDWTEFDELDPANFGHHNVDEFTETRDPEEMGVVALPAVEAVADEHIMGVGTLPSRSGGSPNQTYEPNTRQDHIQEILENNDNHVVETPLCWHAHPSRYTDTASEDYVRYRRDFLEWRTAALGFGVLAKGNRTRMTRMWDHLLSEFAPHRPIWGFAANDVSAGSYAPGDRIGERLNDLYLHPDDYDPSNQQASREAITEAIARGQFVQVDRGTWDNETEDPPEYPTIESIVVNQEEGRITLEVSGNYDSIEWISGPSTVVDTGETIEITEDHVPYVRATIKGSTVQTQPFGVDEGEWGLTSNASWGVESVGKWSIGSQS